MLNGRVKTFNASIAALAMIASPFDLKSDDELIVGATVHFGHNRGLSVEENMKVFKESGMISPRDDSPWRSWESERGVYRLSNKMLEDFLEKAPALGLRPLQILGYSTPAYDQGGCPKSQEAIDGFATYCEHVVKKYKGSCQLYQLWNEWDGPCGGGGDAASYLKLAAATYPRIKAVDPEAIVIANSVCTGEKFFEELLKGGILKSCDGVAFHAYHYGKIGDARKPEGYVERIEKLDKLVKTYNDGKEFPIYLSNFGFTVPLQCWAGKFVNGNEPPLFSILKELGVSIVRNGLYEGVNPMMRLVKAKGFRPVTFFGGDGHNDFGHPEMERSLANSELAAKWSVHGVPPKFASAAEQAYKTVNEYKDCVKDWAIGNEPYYWRITAAEYAQYARAVAKGIRLADPSANVMLGSLNITDEAYLRMGVGDVVDSVDRHTYTFYGPQVYRCQTQSTSEVMGIPGAMRQLNSSMQAAGIGQKPIWITEIGVSTYSDIHVMPNLDAEQTASYIGLSVPKMMVGSMAFGASKVLVYCYFSLPMDHLEEDFGMIDRYGLPKAGAAAYRTTTRMLGDARFSGFIKGHSIDDGGIAGFAFRDGRGKDVLAFWRNDAYSSRKFETPFGELMKPAQAVILKTTEPAEIVTIDGATRTVSPENGEVRLSVDEFTVFARGKFSVEFADIDKTDGKVRFPPPGGFLQIQDYPPLEIRSSNRQHGEFLSAASGTGKKVKVTLYNSGASELKGLLSVRVPSIWLKTNPWRVSPVECKIRVPAGEMKSEVFQISVPEDFISPQRTYVIAEFASEQGNVLTDKVLLESKTPSKSTPAKPK